MSQKVSKHTVEEQLLQSRKEGLQDALQVNSMRAHGKVLGMDTFSWINPQLDALTSALASFPFDIVWAGSHEQIVKCLSMQPELATSIETIIVHDKAILNLEKETLNKVKNIVCLEGTKHALELIKAMKKEKCALLFSTMGTNAKNDKEEFEQFISLF
ncbi:MAG TPA: hypothetical protein EYG86_07035 [Crocinitomicaceae bacterium]|nr:hypothetical protein [Crocinitomicaceae bacterium]